MIERKVFAVTARDIIKSEPRGEGDGDLSAYGLARPVCFPLIHGTARLRAFRFSNISLIYALAAVKRNAAMPDFGLLPLGIVGGLLFTESRPGR
jgi:hypothetical protein